MFLVFSHAPESGVCALSLGPLDEYKTRVSSHIPFSPDEILSTAKSYTYLYDLTPSWLPQRYTI